MWGASIALAAAPAGSTIAACPGANRLRTLSWSAASPCRPALPSHGGRRVLGHRRVLPGEPGVRSNPTAAYSSGDQSQGGDNDSAAHKIPKVYRRKSESTPSPFVRIPSPEMQRTKSGVLLLRLASQLKEVAVVSGLLAAWYASNIFYNIYNKQVLSAFPYATTCTFVHLLVASALMALCWLVNAKKAPVFDKRTVQAVMPLSILHLVGFLTTNMSLGAVNVSLTHTIKSLEPFFTVFLSYIFLGSVPTIPVMLTLVPIVAGVVIASATDLSFTWYGFATAMASNLAFQSRNVMSKKYMVESAMQPTDEDGKKQVTILDEINLFACISIAAAALMVPLVLALDGGALAALFASTSGDLGSRVASIMPGEVFWKTALAGVCRTADVLTSYALLSRLNPVTHSVGNCVKRVVVIAVSIAFFGIKASYLNVVGTALALSGVFAYSMAKRMSKESADLSHVAVKAKRQLSMAGTFRSLMVTLWDEMQEASRRRSKVEKA